MKYTVDDKLKSLCGKIAAMGLTNDEWFQKRKKVFVAGPWEAVFSPFKEGYFGFSIKGLRDYTYDVRMTLEDVLRVHQGLIQEIEIEPWGGMHPEDAGMRRTEVKPEVLFNAINDGINEYVNKVLIPRGIVDKEVYHGAPGLVRAQHKIARYFAKHWRVSWWNEPKKRKREKGDAGEETNGVGSL